MTRWVAIFKDTVEMLDIRANQELRDKHVAFAKAHPELLIGGGLRNDVDGDFKGALWVVEVESRQQVVDLIESDPFYFSAYRTFEIFTWGKILEDQIVEL